MAAIDFPNAPTVGQIFVAPNLITYQWTGTLWLPVGATQALYVSDTPPAVPGPNQLWWNSTLGTMFIWYNDGNSTQWVPAMPNLGVPPQTPTNVWRLIQRIVPTATPFVDFTGVPSDINSLWFNFDATPSTNTHDFGIQFYDATSTLVTTGYASAVDVASHAQPTGSASSVAGSSVVGLTSMIFFDYPVANRVVGNASGIRGSGEIPNIREAGRFKALTVQSNYVSDDGAVFLSAVGAGYRSAAFGPLTGLRFLWNPSVNYTPGGAIELWGSP